MHFQSDLRLNGARGQDEADLASQTVIGQTQTQLRFVSASQLRPPQPAGAHPHVCLAVSLTQESALGLAGPYRDFFASVAAELRVDPNMSVASSTSLPSSAIWSSSPLSLLIPTPNAQHRLGDDRSRAQLHPRRCGEVSLRRLEFVGRLLAMALRTRVLLRLDWSPFFWKQVCVLNHSEN